MSEVLSFRDTVAMLRDFMEVAFHTILYLRQIYPPHLFEQQKKYDVPVWASRNPALNQYIGAVVEAISQELIKGSLKKVALVVREDTIYQEPLERFLFDFEWLIPTDRIRNGNTTDFTPSSGGLARAHVNDYLRAFLQKLNTGEAYLLKLPPDVTFTIVIELADDAAPPETNKSRDKLEPSQWIPAEARIASRQGQDSDDDDIDDDRMMERANGSIRALTPLRTARLGIINLQLLVEEMEGKLEYERKQETSRKDGDARDVKGKGRAM